MSWKMNLTNDGRTDPFSYGITDDKYNEIYNVIN